MAVSDSDEPTMKSPEFCRYVSGTTFNDAPWNSFVWVFFSWLHFVSDEIPDIFFLVYRIRIEVACILYFFWGRTRYLKFRAWPNMAEPSRTNCTRWWVHCTSTMCYVAHFLYITSEYTFSLLLSMNPFRNIPPALLSKASIFITTAFQYEMIFFLPRSRLTTLTLRLDRNGSQLTANCFTKRLRAPDVFRRR